MRWALSSRQLKNKIKNEIFGGIARRPAQKSFLFVPLYAAILHFAVCKDDDVLFRSKSSSFNSQFE